MENPASNGYQQSDLRKLHNVIPQHHLHRNCFPLCPIPTRRNSALQLGKFQFYIMRSVP